MMAKTVYLAWHPVPAIVLGGGVVQVTRNTSSDTGTMPAECYKYLQSTV